MALSQTPNLTQIGDVFKGGLGEFRGFGVLGLRVSEFKGDMWGYIGVYKSIWGLGFVVQVPNN